MSLDDKITPEENNNNTEKPKLLTKSDIMEFCLGAGVGAMVGMMGAADETADPQTTMGVLYNGAFFGGISYSCDRWIRKMPSEAALRRGAALSAGCIVGQVIYGLVKYM
ncbi:MAG: hypothetical protein AABW48_02370 [Nanoarchaeota archaeon]